MQFVAGRRNDLHILSEIVVIYPKTDGRVSAFPFAGEMSTFSPPARCCAAKSRHKNRPVASKTTVPISPQGSAEGSFSAMT